MEVIETESPNVFVGTHHEELESTRASDTSFGTIRLKRTDHLEKLWAIEMR